MRVLKVQSVLWLVSGPTKVYQLAVHLKEFLFFKDSFVVVHSIYFFVHFDPNMDLPAKSVADVLKLLIFSGLARYFFHVITDIVNSLGVYDMRHVMERQQLASECELLSIIR